MEYREILSSAEEILAKNLTHFKAELAGLQIGRASSTLVENLKVEVYGAPQPLKNLANLSLPDSQTIFIEPWDKTHLTAITKAIQVSKLNLNPGNDGGRIMLKIPPLTTERRQELRKLVGEMAENARIAVRRTREDYRKKSQDLPKEEKGIFEKKLQVKVDEVNAEIAQLTKKKEAEILEIGG